MSQNYQRDLSIRQAEALLNAGYDNEYVQKKLIKEGFTPAEAASVLKTLTGRAAVIRQSEEFQPLMLDNLSQNPFPKQQADSESARQEATRKAVAMIEGGYNANTIYQRLLQQGYSDATIRAVLSRFVSTKAGVSPYQRLMGDYPNTRDSGSRDKQIITGVLSIVIGIIVTIIAFQYDAPDSAYFVTIGMIITGTFNILRNLSR